MKSSINQATLMKTSMEQFLEASYKAGFDGVELRRDETFSYLENHSIEELKHLLIKYDLKVVTWNAIELFSLCSEAEFLDMYDYTERLMKIGNEIGCDFIIAVPSFKKDAKCHEEKFVEMTVERFKILRQLAKKYDFRMGFEPLGFPDCSVRKIEFALDILDKCEEDGLPKSGLVIDTFHFFLGEHTPGDLSKVPKEKLWLIHFNDSIKKPISELQDSDRVWPGEGYFKLEEFIKVAKELGYDEYISLELFNPEYWKQNPMEIAIKARKSLDKYL